MAKWPVHSWQIKSGPTFARLMGIFWGCESWLTGGSPFQQMMWVMEVCHLLCVTQASGRLCSLSHVPIRTLHLSLPNLVQTHLQPAEPTLARSMRNFWEPALLYGLYKIPRVPEALWEEEVFHSPPRLPSRTLHLRRANQASLPSNNVHMVENRSISQFLGLSDPSCKASTIPQQPNAHPLYIMLGK